MIPLISSRFEKGGSLTWPALRVGGEDHRPGPARYFEGHFISEKNPICICKIYFLIGYTHTNTNIGPLTKLFLWFRLVISPLALGLDL
ncbi:hypothetical protein Hanom_Chr01g00048121 [Helianthus anomalus]